MFTISLTHSRAACVVVLLFGILACEAQNSGQQASQDEASDLQAAEKRSWNNLQSSWGKRRSSEELSPLERESLNALVLSDLLEALRYSQYEDEDEDFLRSAMAQKRAWKNMNGAWGKRVGGDWNKFRGSWGKREPGWNNLKGLWGKRDSWNKLQPAWGKRSDASAENF